MSPTERKRAPQARQLSFATTDFDNRPRMPSKACASDRLTSAGNPLRAPMVHRGAQ